MFGQAQPLKAIAASFDLPQSAEVPDWVHLLPPPGQDILTFDGRGPYRYNDPAALIAASFAADPRDQGGLIIDENHAADFAAPIGLPSPARGRIVAMEARPDGIWGRVEWNASGRTLLAEKAYRGVSATFYHTKADGEVLTIARASLVNNPNLKGLRALNAETSMTFMEWLAGQLGKTGAGEDELKTALTTMMEAAKSPAPEKASMAEIGALVGVTSPAAIVEAVKALQASQASVAALSAKVATLETAQKRGAADAWMAAQLAAKRGIPADKREGLIALHMQDATQAEGIAAMYPDLAETHTGGKPPAAGEPIKALSAEQLAAARAVGADPAAVLKTLQAEEARA